MRELKFFMIGVLIAIGIASCTEAIAHEMTPTYPKLEPSHLDGVYKTTMEMFNKRADVEYYEIGVFDKDFNAIPFVTSYNIIKIDYLGHVTFDVYIRKSDAKRAAYVCSRSKLRKDASVRTAVASKICSKFK
jgi:hypothetical protein